MIGALALVLIAVAGASLSALTLLRVLRRRGSAASRRVALTHLLVPVAVAVVTLWPYPAASDRSTTTWLWSGGATTILASVAIGGFSIAVSVGKAAASGGFELTSPIRVRAVASHVTGYVAFPPRPSAD